MSGFFRLYDWRGNFQRTIRARSLDEAITIACRRYGTGSTARG